MIKLYTIRDLQADVFEKIFAFNSEGEAKRVFLQACLDTTHAIGQFPDDYVLYHIGEYDDTNGIPHGHDPVRVITGVEILNQHKQRMDKLAGLNREIDEIQQQEIN